MELEELQQRLITFCKAQYKDPSVCVSELFKMPGHAGFAYSFSVESNARLDKWYLRLPPPDVKLQGTADVSRQVATLDVMPMEVPHCEVKWSGDDKQWFGRPFFIVPQLQGDVVRQDGTGWVAQLEQSQRSDMAKQTVQALAAIHKTANGQASQIIWHSSSSSSLTGMVAEEILCHSTKRPIYPGQQQISRFKRNSKESKKFYFFWLSTLYFRLPKTQYLAKHSLWNI